MVYSHGRRLRVHTFRRGNSPKVNGHRLLAQSAGVVKNVIRNPIYLIYIIKRIWD